MGTPITTPGSNRENCPKISTACVIWQGPDIPCINLCAGDAIDDVVFKLATQLCNVTENILDVSSLQFSCLVQSGAQNPQTLLQVLQLIITKVCSLPTTTTTTTGTGRPGDGIADPYIDLPECLYYTNDDGDLVTTMLLSEYVVYLANTICTLINDIAGANSSIINLEGQVATLRQDITNLQNYNYQTYVTSQCVSAPTPGQSILIQEAFQNLEASYCNMLGSIGVSTVLIAAVNRQCPGLSSSEQLSSPSSLMSDLSGWVATPTTAADAISNLWLTLCDTRSALQSLLATPPVIPCVLAVPEAVSVMTIGTSYTTVIWDAPSYAGIESPIGYRVEVFAWTGTAPTGPSLFDATLSSSTYSVNIGSGSISIGSEYVVYVHAIYSCGESNGASVVSELLVPTILFQVQVAQRGDADTSVYCAESGSPILYTVNNAAITLTLVNASTGLPVINTYGTSINVVLRFGITSCSFYGTSHMDVTIPILNGDSTAEYIFPSLTYNNCGTALCTTVNTSLECGVSISDMYTEFDTGTITVCV